MEDFRKNVKLEACPPGWKEMRRREVRVAGAELRGCPVPCKDSARQVWGGTEGQEETENPMPPASALATRRVLAAGLAQSVIRMAEM